MNQSKNPFSSIPASQPLRGHTPQQGNAGAQQPVMGKNAQRQVWEKKAGTYTLPPQGALSNKNNTPAASLRTRQQPEGFPSHMLFTCQTRGRACGAVLAVFGANTAVWAKQATG